MTYHPKGPAPVSLWREGQARKLMHSFDPTIHIARLNKLIQHVCESGMLSEYSHHRPLFPT
jgi:hypothetical protein